MNLIKDLGLKIAEATMATEALRRDFLYLHSFETTHDQLASDIATSLRQGQSQIGDLVAKLHQEQVELEILKGLASRVESKIATCWREVFGVLFHELNCEFLATMTNVNAFRDNYSKAFHAKARDTFAIFARKVEQLQSMSNNWALDADQTRRLASAKNAVNFAQLHVQPSAPAVILLYNAHFVVQALDIAQDVQRKEKLKDKWIEILLPQFRTLSQDHQDLIDEKVFVLGSGPENTPGWGKDHRFDDMPRFVKAVYGATHEVCITHLKENEKFDSEDQLRDFYQRLHGFAKGPQNTDPVEWGKRQLPYLCDFFGNIIREIKKNQPPEKPLPVAS